MFCHFLNAFGAAFWVSQRRTIYARMLGKVLKSNSRNSLCGSFLPRSRFGWAINQRIARTTFCHFYCRNERLRHLTRTCSTYLLSNMSQTISAFQPYQAHMLSSQAAPNRHHLSSLDFSQPQVGLAFLDHIYLICRDHNCVDIHIERSRLARSCIRCPNQLLKTISSSKHTYLCQNRCIWWKLFVL